MGMVEIAASSSHIRFCGGSLPVTPVMIVAVFMAVVSKMCRVARRVFQRIANTHCGRVCDIQRKDKGKKKGKSGAHGETITDE